METTTNLSRLRKGTGRFSWGRIIEWYDIDIYTIVKYEADFGNDKGEIKFHYWVAERDTCHSTNTLEGALAGAMAYNFDGINSQAGYFFCRMIGVEA